MQVVRWRSLCQWVSPESCLKSGWSSGTAVYAAPSSKGVCECDVCVWAGAQERLSMLLRQVRVCVSVMCVCGLELRNGCLCCSVK